MASSLLSAIKFTAGLRTQNEALGIFLSVQEKSLRVTGVGETKFYVEKIPYETASKIEEKSFSLDTKKLAEFIQSLTDDKIEIELSETGIQVSSGGVRARFPITIVPLVPDVLVGKTSSMSINPKILADTLPNLLFCVASDSARPTLSTIKFIPQADGKLIIVATDGFRLSLVQTSFPNTTDNSLQIPATFLRDVFLSMVKRETPVEMVFYEGGKLGICQEGMCVGTKLVSGDFPPYERVLLKTHQYNILINRVLLAHLVKTMSIFARDYSNILVFDFSDKKLHIRPKKEAGQENGGEMEVEFQGSDPQDLKIAFNYKYILDYLASVEDEYITMRCNRSDSPVLFLPGKIEMIDSHEGAAYQHIIMPVRIQE